MVAPIDGASTDPHKSTQTLVYNSATVNYVGGATVGTATTTGQPRQALRFEIQPVGYGDRCSTDVYI